MATPTVTEPAERLAAVVSRLNRRLGVNPGGLGQGMVSVLATIVKRGPLRLTDLAQFEGLSAPSITRSVAELEVRGLVRRSGDPADGRAVLIVATEEGVGAVARAHTARAQLVVELMSCLGATDRAAVERALPGLERMVE